ncbi:MAG: septum formation initiator family protein [Candidatus Moranbacteria bacterium]|nr:septum formation initiator family protein [Candidatus Moranbacteria bacterium]
MVQRRKKSEQNRKSVKFFSGLFFLAGLAVLVIIGISLGKETYRKRQIQKEIENLQGDIQKVGQENSDLNNLISYLSSQEFQEKEAREKLNLQKDDEKMIVLRKDVAPQNGQQANENAKSAETTEDNTPNWKKWLGLFFSKEN